MASRRSSKRAASTGKKPGEDHGLRLLEARQRLHRGVPVVGHRVADARVRHLLDGAGEEADFAGPQRVHHLALRPRHADALRRVGGVGGDKLDLLALAQFAVDDAHQHHDAEIGVVPAVDEQRLQRRVAIAFRRRQAVDDSFQHIGNAKAGLRRDHHRVGRVDADNVLDLLLDALGLGGGEIDLVENRNDFVVIVDGLIDVRQRLRLDALARIDDEERSLAGRERARDLVGEVHMPRRVDEIEHILLAVPRLVVEPDRVGFDRDPALALKVHRVEDLVHHLAIGHGPAELDQPVCECGFPVVDMGDDGKIADMRKIGHCAAVWRSGERRSSAGG